MATNYQASKQAPNTKTTKTRKIKGMAKTKLGIRPKNPLLACGRELSSSSTGAF